MEQGWGNDQDYQGAGGNLCWPMMNQSTYGQESFSSPRRLPGSGGLSGYERVPDTDQFHGYGRFPGSSGFHNQPERWDESENWRRTRGQPGCPGSNVCLNDSRTCNYKYQYGVDDVGPCPTRNSCTSSYRCAPRPVICSNPCPAVPDCNRLTTRCFDWPLPHRDKCTSMITNLDLRPPRADLNVLDGQPQRCPTCKRTVVDMACGPLSYNY